MAAFFAMGGYAAYVWPAFGATFAGLGGAIALTLLAYRRARVRVDALERK